MRQKIEDIESYAMRVRILCTRKPSAKNNEVITERIEKILDVCKDLLDHNIRIKCLWCGKTFKRRSKRLIGKPYHIKCYEQMSKIQEKLLLIPIES